MKWLIKNDNLTGFGCGLFFAAGLWIIYLSVEYSSNYSTKMIGLSLGMALMAIGGYSAKAATLHLRPFGKSPWRIAKETYKDSPKEAPDSSKSDSDDHKS